MIDDDTVDPWADHLPRILAEQTTSLDELSVDDPRVVMSAEGRARTEGFELRRLANVKLWDARDSRVILGLVFDPLTSAEVLGLAGTSATTDLAQANIWRVFVLVDGGSRGYLLRWGDEAGVDDHLSLMLEDLIADAS